MSRKFALVIAVLGFSIVVPAQRRGMAPSVQRMSTSGARAATFMRGMHPRARPGVMVRARAVGHSLQGSRFDRHFGRHRVGDLGACLSLGLDFTTCKERFAFSSSFLLFAPFWGGYYVYPNGGETYGSEDGTNYDVITQLSEEVSQLNAQVARLREEHDVMVYDQQERRNPATRPDASKSEPPAPTPTSLIFRDGSRMDVQNYVVLGKTLWIFGEQRAHKLPLSDLDLDLTRLVNDEEGVDFLAAH